MCRLHSRSPGDVVTPHGRVEGEARKEAIQEVADHEPGHKFRGGKSLGDQGAALSRATEWSRRMVRTGCPDC